MKSPENIKDISDKIINDYREKAAIRFSEYEISSPHHFLFFLKYLKKAPAFVLDIGSGSGRDAAWYASQGYTVTAVEPAHELRILGQEKHTDPSITWLDDRLPDLSMLDDRQNHFAHIHMNAVIFHLPPDYTRTVLQKIHDLLEDQGTFFLSVRMGPTDPARPMFSVSTDHVLIQASGLFELLESGEGQDSRKRPGISWDRLIFKKIAS